MDQVRRHALRKGELVRHPDCLHLMSVTQGGVIEVEAGYVTPDGVEHLARYAVDELTVVEIAPL